MFQQFSLPHYLEGIFHHGNVQLTELIDLQQYVEMHFLLPGKVIQFIQQDLHKRFDVFWGSTHLILSTEARLAATLIANLSKIRIGYQSGFSLRANYQSEYSSLVAELKRFLESMVEPRVAEARLEYNTHYNSEFPMSHYTNSWGKQPYRSLIDVINFYLVCLSIAADLPNYVSTVRALTPWFAWLRSKVITKNNFSAEYNKVRLCA